MKMRQRRRKHAHGKHRFVEYSAYYGKPCISMIFFGTTTNYLRLLRDPWQIFYGGARGYPITPIRVNSV